ncbi:MAG: hypothetical protein AUJ52_14930 [Elusimicrobia bacterium CG1_02_63_36]|nr:MAG: hypothetical protein AUJ52_14930 [Elusimicrobia bacterium CG1_02_63_36]
MQNNHKETGIVLRPYQEAAMVAWDGKREAGLRRGIINLPTGCGKTVTGLAIAKRLGARTLWLAHRDELIEQPQRAMRAVWPAAETGVVKADRDETDAQVVFGSIQTVSRPGRLEGLSGFDLVVVDECFPAGTLVDGKPIEKLVPGDLVWSVSPTGLLERRAVRRVFKRKPSGLLRVTVAGIGDVICTPGHPFFSDGRWVPAYRLRPGSGLVLWKQEASDEDRSLRLVRGEYRRDRQAPPGSPAQIGKGLLLRILQSCLCQIGILANNVQNEQDFCVRENAGEQSHAPPVRPREDVCDAQKDRPRAVASRRERTWTYETASRPCRRIRMGDGICSSDEDRPGERLSQPLQAGYRAPGAQDRDRSGRRQPQRHRAQTARSEEGRALGFARVESVEVLEPRGDEEFGGLCPGGHVYNLEVERNHNYFVSGILVHNCHHAAAATYRRTLEHLGCFNGGPPTLGLTATVERGDRLGLDTAFQEIVYQLQLLQAIKDGWLVDLRTKQVELNFSLDDIGLVSSDYNQGQLGEAMFRAGAAEATAEAYVEHAPGRKALIFTVTVDQARRTADALQARGVAAEFLSGDTPIDERRAILRRLKTGDTMVVCNCAVLTEGFDEPSISAVMIARPTRSKTLYLQMIGRGTRIFPGKEDCLIIDLAGASSDHKLVQAPALFGLNPDEVGDETVTEALEEQDERKSREDDLVQSYLEANKERRARKSIHWVEASPDLYALSAGNHGMVLMAKRSDGWIVEVAPRDRWASHEKLQSAPVDLELAQGIGEDYIRRARAETLVSENASWRRRPASSKVLNALTKFRINPPPGLTAGEAGDLLSAAIARCAARRMG